MNKVVKEILSNVIWLAVVFALTMLIIEFVVQRTVVSGESMMYTLQDEDSLLVDKISYRFSDPERFDIVIFPYPSDPEECFIKRIIGLPGETIQIDDDGKIWIDGEILEENYGAEVIWDAGLASEPITLGDDEYFVMGDNRNHSMDSRDPSVGNIKRDDFIGKAFIRIYPFETFGGLD
jgi:signal peptidase I